MTLRNRTALNRDRWDHSLATHTECLFKWTLQTATCRILCAAPTSEVSSAFTYNTGLWLTSRLYLSQQNLQSFDCRLISQVHIHWTCFLLDHNYWNAYWDYRVWLCSSICLSLCHSPSYCVCTCVCFNPFHSTWLIHNTIGQFWSELVHLQFSSGSGHKSVQSEIPFTALASHTL